MKRRAFQSNRKPQSERVQSGRRQAVAFGCVAFGCLWIGLGLTFVPAVNAILPVAFVTAAFGAIGLGILAAGRV